MWIHIPDAHPGRPNQPPKEKIRCCSHLTEQSTGDDDLNEIDAVALVVEFVGGNVEKFGHGLQILTAVCQTFKDAIAKADRVVLLFFI